MLLSQFNIVVRVTFNHVDVLVKGNVTGSWINGLPRCNPFDEVVVAVARSKAKNHVFQLLKASANEQKTFVTNQRTGELVDCICDQCLTFLCFDVNEVAIAVQLRNHA